jgi:hypothetical protein
MDNRILIDQTVQLLDNVGLKLKRLQRQLDSIAPLSEYDGELKVYATSVESKYNDALLTSGSPELLVQTKLEVNRQMQGLNLEIAEALFVTGQTLVSNSGLTDR